ncbi:hypothetical protein F8388_008150 [Cannabis sativa]|uniref:Uncharacterized protein n=1 Tax=Cannabis sativa TaxID=3483 RepID=A0A7J6EVE1_CANSA|nr:hypothetical protein F8388_008150 [Cannabis sativa]
MKNRLHSSLILTSSVKNLSRLSFLDLGSNNFNGQLPSILFELPSLQYLDLGFNQYRGPLTIPNVPFSSQLTNLYLYSNKLTQKIPRSIFEMKKLDELNLSENDLSGTIEMSMFSKLSQLRALYLSDNNLSVVTNTITNSTLIFKMNYLGLASCNITEFPKFLKTQIELKLLDLSNNKIEGKIPKCFFCIGVETLDSLDMSANFITGWEQELKVLLWKVLQTLDLSHSSFHSYATKTFFSIHIPLHPNITILTPTGTPRILNQPILSTIVCSSISYGCDTMVQLGSTFSGEDTT